MEDTMTDRRHKAQMEIMWVDFSEVLSRVEDGACLEAKDALKTISSLLLPTLDSAGEEYRKIPAYICDYLSRALFKIADGIDPNHALGLKNIKGGRPCTLSYRDELRVANIVYDLHKIQGIPVMDACLSTVEMLQEMAEKLDDYYIENNPNGKRPLKSNPFLAMENIINVLIKNKPREALDQQLKFYYDKHKPTLQKIWEEPTA